MKKREEMIRIANELTELECRVLLECYYSDVRVKNLRDLQQPVDPVVRKRHN